MLSKHRSVEGTCSLKLSIMTSVIFLLYQSNSLVVSSTSSVA